MRVAIADGIRSIDPTAWDRLRSAPSPFCEYGFLAALESSGSVGPGTGWAPLFPTVWDGDELVGAAPVYLKEHSYGEYIFDWAWAEGSQRAGLPYYPKLVVAAPFTPATGRRLLVAPGASDEVPRILARTVRELAQQLNASSVHWLFVLEEEQALLEEEGYTPRITLQYHWRNRGWSTFEDYLGAMKSKRRREIRRERRKVEGIDVHVVAGPDMTNEEWASVDRFYRDTAARKWGTPYLTPQFFEHIRETFAHRVELTVAYRDGELMAGALAFRRDDALYGRYWGCDQRLRQLHFETCFYAPIEHCIEEGIQVYEAGAQGEHKISRGFEPSPVRSSHWIAHPGLREAIDDFLAQERRHSGQAIARLAQHLPYTEP
jgi:predicted N-acyltransferase